MPEGFWGNPEGALGEQRCLRMSTKGTQRRAARYSLFLLVYFKKGGQEV